MRQAVAKCQVEAYVPTQTCANLRQRPFAGPQRNGVAGPNRIRDLRVVLLVLALSVIRGSDPPEGSKYKTQQAMEITAT